MIKMVLILIIFISVVHLSAAKFEIDRQSTSNENYDTLSRYRNGETSSYSGSGGYYPRTIYDQINQNRLNSDLNGREFRPPNVFGAGIMASPHFNQMLAQQRQYQISIPGATGLVPQQVNSPSFLQSPGYPIASPLENQFSGGYSSAMSPYAYGGVPNRIGLGESLANGGQVLGNYLPNPYYGENGFNRQSLSYGPQSYMNPYAAYGAQGFAHSPLYSQQFSQLSNYPTLGYANQPYGHMNRAYSNFGAYPSQSYQNQPFNGQYGYNSYNGYNGVSSNSGVSSGQNGVTDNSRDERNYASSATHNENVAHSGSHSTNESPLSYQSNNQDGKNEEHGFYKRKGVQKNIRSKEFIDQSMIE